VSSFSLEQLNIDNPSHFGGFLCGGLLGALVHHRWEGKWDGVDGYFLDMEKVGSNSLSVVLR
jgi:hypothetical protein